MDNNNKLPARKFNVGDEIEALYVYENVDTSSTWERGEIEKVHEPREGEIRWRYDILYHDDWQDRELPQNMVRYPGEEASVYSSDEEDELVVDDGEGSDNGEEVEDGLA